MEGHCRGANEHGDWTLVVHQEADTVAAFYFGLSIVLGFPYEAYV